MNRSDKLIRFYKYLPMVVLEFVPEAQNILNLLSYATYLTTSSAPSNMVAHLTSDSSPYFALLGLIVACIPGIRWLIKRIKDTRIGSRSNRSNFPTQAYPQQLATGAGRLSNSHILPLWEPRCPSPVHCMGREHGFFRSASEPILGNPVECSATVINADPDKD